MSGPRLLSSGVDVADQNLAEARLRSALRAKALRLVIHPSERPGPLTVSVALIRTGGQCPVLERIEHLEVDPDLGLDTPEEIYEHVMKALDPTR